MKYSLWWIWIMFLGVFLPTIGYGWGYRRWGPPLPRYLQRRRSQNAKAAGSTIDHHAWGRTGDVLWAMVLVWMMWAIGTWFFIGSPWS